MHLTPEQRCGTGIETRFFEMIASGVGTGALFCFSLLTAVGIFFWLFSLVSIQVPAEASLILHRDSAQTLAFLSFALRAQLAESLTSRVCLTSSRMLLLLPLPCRFLSQRTGTVRLGRQTSVEPPELSPSCVNPASG